MDTTMYIEFLSPSPKAGQQEHVSVATGDALITAGLAMKVRPPQKPDEPAVWELGHLTQGHPSDPPRYFLQLRCPTCSRKDRFDGPPSQLHIMEEMACVHASRPMPEKLKRFYTEKFIGQKLTNAEFYHALNTGLGAKPHDANVGFYDKNGNWTFVNDRVESLKGSNSGQDDKLLAAASRPTPPDPPQSTFGQANGPVPKTVPREVLVDAISKLGAGED